MKRDIAVAVVAIIVVGAICFALAAMRPPFQPTESHPFTTAKVGPRAADRIVIRVNGEAVTEQEYQAAFRQLPQDMQQQFASETGKMAFAEQLVRMKLLEQEARRLGLEQDPKISGTLAAQRTDVLADAAAEKLIAQPTDEAIRNFYAQNRDKFETLDVSHILIAYAGSAAKPRGGGAPPSPSEALNRAMAAYAEMKKGASFAETARKYSDDVTSAREGGELGMVSHGMLPPELDTRIFQIPTGKISEPIQSRFGIHIFKVNGRGTRPLEQVRTVIAQRVRQQNMFDRVEILRRNAKVDFDEKYFPEARKWPSGRKPS